MSVLQFLMINSTTPAPLITLIRGYLSNIWCVDVLTKYPYPQLIANFNSVAPHNSCPISAARTLVQHPAGVTSEMDSSRVHQLWLRYYIHINSEKMLLLPASNTDWNYLHLKWECLPEKSSSLLTKLPWVKVKENVPSHSSYSSDSKSKLRNSTELGRHSLKQTFLNECSLCYQSYHLKWLSL